MSDKQLRKYGVLLTTAKAIQFDLYEVDGINFRSDATFATGDVKISQDGGAEANTTNLPVDEGQGYRLILTATELQSSRIRLSIVDQSGTKVWLDKTVLVETYGNASAMHAFDYDTASVAQTGDSYSRIGSNGAGLSDCITATGFNTVVPPSVAQFNARSLPSADLFNHTTDNLNGKGDWNIGKTGYDLNADQSAVTIGIVTTNTDMRGTDGANTVVPATRAEAASDRDAILTEGGNSWTTGAGGSSSNPWSIASGTIGATGNSTTALHLTGLTQGDDEINDYLLVITDNSTGEVHSRWIDDWVLSTELATVVALPFTPEDSTDTYAIVAMQRSSAGGDATAASQTSMQAQLTTLTTRLSSARAGYIDNLNGHTAQSGDVFAQLPANFGDLAVNATTGEVSLTTAQATAIAVAVETALLNEGDGQAVLQGIADQIAADWVAGDASPLAIASAVWAAASRTLTAGTNIALAKGVGVTGFNDFDPATDTVANVTTVATNTDMRGTDGANTTTPPTAIENADALLNRDMSLGVDSGSSTVRTVRQALRFLRNKWSLTGSTLEVTKEDDSTSSWTATVSTDAAADPVTGSNPTGGS